MSQAFTGKYIRTYFWQGISFALNFASMFLVTPLLTKSPAIYGIYVICISLNIFFTYADLGFISAGYRYASEAFVKKDRDGEMQSIGFVAFLLLIALVPFCAIIVGVSFFPHVLIKNLTEVSQQIIASRLLLILAIFSPVLIINRIVQIIFGIRIEEYLPKRIAIISSAITICSSFYFFSHNNQNIVGYYLFSQSCNFIAVLYAVVIAKKRYDYNLKALTKRIRFSKAPFDQMKKYAVTSFYGTLLFVLYFELDPVAITKLLGPEQLAFYAIGLTLFSLLRTMHGILFTPFCTRVNHFVGTGDTVGLQRFFKTIISLTLPITIFPIITIIMFMRPFILAWVGIKYEPSIVVASLLVSMYLFSYVHYPASILLMAQEKFRIVNILNSVILVVVWGGIFLMISWIGIASFALMKCITYLIWGIFYTYVTIKLLNVNLQKYLKEFFAPAIIPVFVIILAGFFLSNHMPTEKSKINLLLNIGIISGTCLASFVVYYGTSKIFRKHSLELCQKALISFKLKQT